jgi:hypothetical protein
MTKTQTRYNTDDQDSIRTLFEQILSSCYATWDSPVGQGLHEMSLDQHQAEFIHDNLLHNSADPNSEALLVVDDTARRIFNEVNREQAASLCTDLEELLHVARTQALAQDKGGQWTTTLKSADGDDITTHMYIEVVTWPRPGGNRHAMVEAVEFEPGPDIELSDGGDLYKNGNLERAVVEHDHHTIQSALNEFDVEYDTVDPWKIQYTEFAREKWLGMQPIWISQDESQRLISLLT